MTKPSTIAVVCGEMFGNAPGSTTPKPTQPRIRAVKQAPTPPIMTEEQLAKREEMRSKLQVGTWVIEFTKVDGTNSIMEATLDPRLLTESDPTVFAGAGRPEQNHLLHVYAVDRQGWRSFLVNNVTRMYRPSENL